MTIHFKRNISTALLFISAAQMAQAQVTGQDVWTDWKNYMAGFGYEVTGNETTSGDTLTISDLNLTMALPEGDGILSMDMNTLELATNSDGTVAVTMSGNMPISFSSDKDDIEAVVNYTQNGFSLIVSGTPDDLNYNYTVAQVGIDLASLKVEGEMMPADVVRLGLTVTNVISSTQMKIGDLRDYSQRMSADSLTYDMAFNDPDSDDAGAYNGSVLGLSFQGSGKIPVDMNTDDITAMLAAGFAFDGFFGYTSSSASLNVVGDNEQFAFDSTSQGGKLGVAMDASRLGYDYSQSGISFNVTTNQLPFPVSLEMAEIAFELDAPLSQSDDEQDFSFITKIRDFTISDAIWGMLDPGGVLPRDPASIVLDISGKAKVLVDYLDPEYAENLDEIPAELNALTVNELLVSAAGAKLTGTGDFTFDNSDIVTFDGMPAPTGVANLALSGANGLMDKLIQMGLLSDNDAMGARMMMGLMAVAGDGEDTLKSKIEVTGDGQILANGQRMR